MHDTFLGIPSITVICDGGWSKRTHKHLYNAMGGVGVIIGAKTKKLLHIGIRNKYCYICQQADNVGCQPKQHKCFKNWSLSSQAMESDLIFEGFLIADKLGVRYMNVIGNGDSSVYVCIREEVSVWDTYVKKGNVQTMFVSVCVQTWKNVWIKILHIKGEEISQKHKNKTCKCSAMCHQDALKSLY